jgi:hypothetical protein
MNIVIHYLNDFIALDVFVLYSLMEVVFMDVFLECAKSSKSESS